MLRLVDEPDVLSRWMEGLFPPAQVGFTRALYGVGAMAMAMALGLLALTLVA
jgi:hypothetical protein